MKRWVGLALLFLTVGALALRGPDLALRPMHNDEAVNAIKLRDLWQHGRYVYDPNEHHGPTLYYATLPFVWLSGARDFTHLSETTLRAVAVFFGVALIPLLWLLQDGLGRGATIVAAFLTAISPAMVFYSRYFIHEMLLVFFTLLVIAAGWRYVRKPSAAWAALAGTGVGLMYATKETFLIPLAAMVLGLAVVVLAEGREKLALLKSYWHPRHVAVGIAAALVVSLLFFTSFFTNAHGPLDSLRTYLPWLKRAAGDSPHIHPWYFYLQRLVWFQEARGPHWSEGLIVGLAVIGAVASMRRRLLDDADLRLVRFLVVFTLIVTAAYSAIAYKTPWCLLGFLQGFILLAGVGAMVLVRASRGRILQIVTCVALLAGAANLAWQAWRASFPFASDRRNPYVYAQTVPDTLKLVDKVKALARVHPDGDQMLIKVMAPDSDYWPLPWYLRQFQRVGWWGRIPADPYSPVMIVGAKWQAALDEKSDKRWLMVGYFELRPKTFLELYVKFDLWEKYIQSLPAASSP